MDKPLKKKFELVEVIKQTNPWDKSANPTVVLKLEEKVQNDNNNNGIADEAENDLDFYEVRMDHKKGIVPVNAESAAAKKALEKKWKIERDEKFILRPRRGGDIFCCWECCEQVLQVSMQNEVELVKFQQTSVFCPQMPCGRNIYPFPKISKEKRIELSNNDCLQSLPINDSIQENCTEMINVNARQDAIDNHDYDYAMGRIPRKLDLARGPPVREADDEKPEEKEKNEWE